MTEAERVASGSVDRQICIRVRMSDLTVTCLLVGTEVYFVIVPVDQEGRVPAPNIHLFGFRILINAFGRFYQV